MLKTVNKNLKIFLSRPLREICDEKDLRLQDLARLTGMGRSTIGNFLQGKTVAGEKLLKQLADALKLKLDEIDNPQPGEDRLLEGVDAEDVWMRRAILAEKELADLRLGLRRLLDSPEHYRPKPKSNSVSTDAIADLVDEAAQESEPRSAPKSKR